MERSTRRRVYFTMMGICLVLILLAWNLVRLWSVSVAVVMSVVAALIPPTAVIIANFGSFDPADLDPDSEQDGAEDSRPG